MRSNPEIKSIHRINYPQVLYIMKKSTICLVLALNLTGCSKQTISTFPEWCGQINQTALQEKEASYLVVLDPVNIDGDAIRDDYVKFLNDTHMEKVENRAPEMAWREGTALHLINLSSLLEIEPEKVINGWRNGVEAVKHYKHENDVDICLYGTLASMFDSLHIHSMKTDSLGRNWTDEVTIILTARSPA